MDGLAQMAITAALTGDWQNAVRLNRKIISQNSLDTDALNRLARGLSETGQIEEAKKTAEKVLKIDPFNSIAQKSLQKWKNYKDGEKNISNGGFKPQTFLEEPGKTRAVSLLRVGGSQVLAKLDTGDEVKLNCHQHRATITSLEGKYIGTLPDDISARLKKLTAAGNEYQVLIKSIDSEEVKVFIRETKRSHAVSDIPSFSLERIEYISFTPPELVHKKDNMKPTGDDDGETF